VDPAVAARLVTEQADPDGRAVLELVLAPLNETPTVWTILAIVAGIGTLVWIACVAYTIAKGIGTWGNNIPVSWAFAIINFVWWIGIGHAGTFISAFLLLLNQTWRAAVSRMAEAMTLIAVAIASTFPILHLGRPWFFYWLVPYPATTGLWPNFKSALPWDTAAIGAYLLVSLMFFYLGLVPDLASARDGMPGPRRRRIYGVFAIGWSGAGSQWRRRRAALKIVAGIAAALVVSVHSIVSFDFSTAQVSGWHSTIFPPYFVIGAVYSGFAMVLTLAIPIRVAYRWESLITIDHLERLAKLLLTIGLLVGYCYVVEWVIAFRTHDARERAMHLVHWPFGPFAVLYWLMLLFNVGTPQLFWFRRLRRTPGVLFAGAVVILAGMWLERFVIVIASLSRGDLSSSWFDYTPTWVDWGIFGGSICLFGLVFLLFLRFVPAAAIDELRRHRFERAVELER
jgi:molybdopterin-containing oxidoreductase family membrane subunit